jgi:hypothetical protein
MPFFAEPDEQAQELQQLRPRVMALETSLAMAWGTLRRLEWGLRGRCPNRCWMRTAGHAPGCGRGVLIETALCVRPKDWVGSERGGEGGHCGE